MKRALILLPHGLGDTLMATPALRKIAEDYEIDIMLRDSVVRSGLLNDCPYIRDQFSVENHWQVEGAKEAAIEQFREMRKDYEYSAESWHEFIPCGFSKAEVTADELGVKVTDWRTEAFISPNDQLLADEYLDNFSKPLFVHAHSDLHECNRWPEWEEWAEKNLIYEDVIHGKDLDEYPVNVGIAVASGCDSKIVVNSLYYHGLVATKSYIDLAVFPSPDRKVIHDTSKTLRIMECGVFLDRDNEIWRV